jgi:hypothetical protein
MAKSNYEPKNNKESESLPISPPPAPKPKKSSQPKQPGKRVQAEKPDTY